MIKLSQNTDGTYTLVLIDDDQFVVATKPLTLEQLSHLAEEIDALINEASNPSPTLRACEIPTGANGASDSYCADNEQCVEVSRDP